ncbi:MAG: helix-turn-helix transcriptional regulator [Candidatus Firestonebacteria bacterium]|nr:helix-turn-helix transcriptional regulator [Candidatus Firestonebacteria bacterium]
MTNNSNATLGERIKNTRLKKRVTLEEVARETNLTPSFLSQIERNIASPSVDSLRKIAQALGTKVSLFFEENNSKGLAFFRKKQVEIIPADLKTNTVRLINDVFNINLHPFLIVLSAESKSEKELPSHDNEEFGMLIKGKVLLTMDNSSHIMDEGDCVYLTSPGKHKLTNLNNSVAEILWIYCSKL